MDKLNDLSRTESLLLGRMFAKENDDGVESCPLPNSVFPKSTPLAMAYVPYQQWETPYESDVALARGTIFPSLDKPFIGEEAVRNAHAE